jgi:hypothetical protein
MVRALLLLLTMVSAGTIGAAIGSAGPDGSIHSAPLQIDPQLQQPCPFGASDLRVEYTVQPTLSIVNPRFSWIVQSTASSDFHVVQSSYEVSCRSNFPVCGCDALLQRSAAAASRSALSSVL